MFHFLSLVKVSINSHDSGTFEIGWLRSSLLTHRILASDVLIDHRVLLCEIVGGFASSLKTINTRVAHRTCFIVCGLQRFKVSVNPSILRCRWHNCLILKYRNVWFFLVHGIIMESMDFTIMHSLLTLCFDRKLAVIVLCSELSRSRNLLLYL